MEKLYTIIMKGKLNLD